MRAYSKFKAMKFCSTLLLPGHGTGQTGLCLRLPSREQPHNGIGAICPHRGKIGKSVRRQINMDFVRSD